MSGESNVCATQKLCEFAVTTDFEQIPAHLVREAKLLLLDHIGCALAGKSVDKGRIAVELAQSLGGAADSTIIGAQGKVAVTNAAFANGELFNALDWDPIPHTLPCVIAGTLALAERERASGAELLAAIVVAYEIASRLAEVLPGDLTPNRTATALRFSAPSLARGASCGSIATGWPTPSASAALPHRYLQ